jgi:5-methylcytosine-specific restriction protein A
MPNRPPIHRPIGWRPWEQRRREHDQQRSAENNKIYDSDWRVLRNRFLAANPFCAEPGCQARATQADHIVSVRQRPDLRLEWSNLRPYCARHHSARTSRDHSWNQPR